MKKEILHKVIPLDVNEEMIDQNKETDNNQICLDTDNNTLAGNNIASDQVVPQFDVSSTVYGNITFEKAMEQFLEKEIVDTNVYGAKIDGTYGDYMKILQSKLQEKNNLQKEKNKVEKEVIIDSYDGAVHLSHDNIDKSII